MDSDEFVARMVAAGIPDMQLMPASAPAAAAQPPSAAPDPVPARAPFPGTHEGVADGSTAASTPGAGPAGMGPRSSLPSWGQSVGIEVLEQEGVALLLAAEAAGQLHSHYRFCPHHGVGSHGRDATAPCSRAQ